MKNTFRVLPFALCLFASAAVQAARGPVDTVAGFYKLRIESGSNGTPSGRDLASFSSYLAPELVCLLGASLRYRDQYAKALPDRALPLSEGDLYSSHPEGPTRFTLGALDGNRIPVHFYRNEADDKGWDDVVQISQVRKRWVIRDIEYSGGHGSLVARLRNTLSHPEAAAGWDARELESCVLEPRPEHGATKEHGKKSKHAGKGTKADRKAKSSHNKKADKATGRHGGKSASKDHSAKSRSHSTAKKTSRSADKNKRASLSKPRHKR